MLNTTELEAATAALTYPQGTMTREERAARRAEYNRLTAEYEALWAIWLAAEYAADLPSSIFPLIFRDAWEEGHSSGYQSVEFAYQERADFARTVAAAVRAA